MGEKAPARCRGFLAHASLARTRVLRFLFPATANLVRPIPISVPIGNVGRYCRMSPANRVASTPAQARRFRRACIRVQGATLDLGERCQCTAIAHKSYASVVTVTLDRRDNSVMRGPLRRYASLSIGIWIVVRKAVCKIRVRVIRPRPFAAKYTRYQSDLT
jgi:hypothetical protein